MHTWNASLLRAEQANTPTPVYAFKQALANQSRFHDAFIYDALADDALAAFAGSVVCVGPLLYEHHNWRNSAGMPSSDV